MPLATLYDDQSGMVKAYISARMVPLLKVGSEATFIGNDGELLNPQLVVDKVIPTAITHLSHSGLASVYGGPIATQKMEEQLIPDTATYEVHLSLLGNNPMTRQQYGSVSLSIEPTSFLVNGLRYIYGIFIRESGF